jgi:hypothetical protein
VGLRIVAASEPDDSDVEGNNDVAIEPSMQPDVEMTWKEGIEGSELLSLATMTNAPAEAPEPQTLAAGSDDPGEVGLRTTNASDVAVDLNIQAEVEWSPLSYSWSFVSLVVELYAANFVATCICSPFLRNRRTTSRECVNERDFAATSGEPRRLDGQPARRQHMKKTHSSRS